MVTSWSITVESDNLFENIQIDFFFKIFFLLFYLLKRLSLTYLFFLQVQKITNNIQFILETVMLSNVVEVQVIFSLCCYCYMISNKISFGQETYRLISKNI